MIGVHRFLGTDFTVGNQAQEANECQLIFGVIDFAAEESDAGAVFFRFTQEFEGVISRAGGAAEDTDDQMRVVVHQLVHGFGAVVHHFEKERTAFGGNSAQGTDNGVVDKLGDLARLNRLGAVGIEDLEKVKAKA